jgi:DNA-binding IclR family transcriptional regulator
VHVAAGAKAILAFSTQEIRDRLLSKEFKRFTANTIIERDILLKQFDEIRKTGVSFDIGEHDIDVHAIGAPILNIEGRAVASIVIAGFPKNIDIDRDSEMVSDVKAAALAISRQLYYSDGALSGR